MATAATPRADAPASVNSWHVVTLRDVDWEAYCQIRDEPANERIRMEYLDGTLILMSPENLHDSKGQRLSTIVDMVAEALRVPCQGTATTTLRRKGTRPRKGSGKEPDHGFYFGENDDRMRNKEEINLDVNPPPDLVIEVDHTRNSAHALAIYARLGVPEAWRYRTSTKALWFDRLVGDRYEPIDRSLNLPRLTPALVVRAVEEAVQLREIDWWPWLRAWAIALPEPPLTT